MKKNEAPAETENSIWVLSTGMRLNHLGYNEYIPSTDPVEMITRTWPDGSTTVEPKQNPPKIEQREVTIVCGWNEVDAYRAKKVGLDRDEGNPCADLSELRVCFPERMSEHELVAAIGTSVSLPALRALKNLALPPAAIEACKSRILRLLDGLAAGRSNNPAMTDMGSDDMIARARERVGQALDHLDKLEKAVQ
jgi:hypothetical protein